MNPTPRLETLGRKTRLSVFDTNTSESDSKASSASTIGAGGVSAQTTKAAKTINTPIRILIITLKVRFKPNTYNVYFHDSDINFSLII